MTSFFVCRRKRVLFQAKQIVISSHDSWIS